jgi:LAO/AO transport system kinase
MEMADMLVITKTDGSNAENAQRAAAEYKSALHLFPMPESKWLPQVLTCSARNNIGISEIWKKILAYKEHSINTGYFTSRRRKQASYWMTETINENLKSNFYSNESILNMIEQLREEVLQDKISSFVAAQQVFRFYLEEMKKKH